jgi:hypothetical protein
MSHSFLLINDVIAAMRLAHRHKDCFSEHEHDESQRRCHNACNDNHQLLFSHGQVQFSIAHRSKAHTIMKSHGDGSEDALQHTYDLVVSFQKTRTRWCIKATGLNATRVGRMLVLRYQEKMQMRNQRQLTTWGTGKKY